MIRNRAVGYKWVEYSTNFKSMEYRVEVGWKKYTYFLHIAYYFFLF